MKVKINRFLLAFILININLTLYAQSGKVPQKTETKPIQSPISEDKKSEKTDSTFVIDSKNDKYKIIFAPSYDGKYSFVSGEDEYQKKTRLSSYANFIQLLNQAGEQGYKLVSLLSADLALVKLDEIQYEYDWFETRSPMFFAKSGLQENMEEISETGFRIVDHSLLSGNCEPLFPEDVSGGESCEYLDFFLAEKVKGEKKSTEQIFINTFPGWGAKPSVELEKQIDEKLAEGFYPTKLFSKFEILLEKAKDKTDILSDKPDIQIVRSSWGRGNIEDKVNELAKQGYRLGLANNGIAVMYRNRETSQTPVFYVWLKTKKKKFEKNLEKLEQKGAVYRTIYPDEKGNENSLIFEQKLKDDKSRKEYRILRLQFEIREDKIEQKVYVDLKPPSKESLEMMKKLTREGFEIKDIFYINYTTSGLILER